MKSGQVYPVFLELRGRPVLIVGGGAVGLRKARGLLECGAAVTVVSVAFAAGFAGLNVEKIAGEYAAGQMRLKRWALAFAATDVGEVNQRVMADAQAAGVLCCRSDEPELGDFSGGAVERAESVTVAVSTGGASPVLAARIAREAKVGVDPVLVRMAGLNVEWRARVKEMVADGAGRRGLLQKLGGEEMERILRVEGEEGARKRFEAWLAAARGDGEGPHGGQ